MLNSDSGKEFFELWLSSGLKKPAGVKGDFAKRVLIRLDEAQQRRILGRIVVQKRIYTGLIVVLISTAAALLCYPPVSMGIFAFLHTLLADLVQLILEPTLGGILVPAAVVLAVAVVVWNLLDIVSLE